MSKSDPDLMVLSAKAPRFSQVLREASENLELDIDKPREAISGILLTLVTAFLPKILELLPCFKPEDDVEPIPVPSPTPQLEIFWKNALALKSQAEDAFNSDTQDYNPRVLRRAANAIQKKERKNGKKIKDVEAVNIARESLHLAREKSRKEIFETIVEAHGNQP